jgi:hypothetical protein
MLGRLLPIIGTWPSFTKGPVLVTLNIVPIILAIITVGVVGIVLLFETDLPVITALLSTLLLSWIVIALVSGNNQAFVGSMFLILAYMAAIGTLMSVWASLEWDERTLTIDGLQGLIGELPFHTIAIIGGILTATGVPFFAAFSGMITVNQSLFGFGNAVVLGGAVLWIGNTLAVIGLARLFGNLLTRYNVAPNAEADMEMIESEEEESETGIESAPVLPTQAMREGGLLLIPLAAILFLGIAPEVFLIGNPGLITDAAQSLLTAGITIPNISSSPLGITLGGVNWLPGLFWILALVIAVFAVLSFGGFTHIEEATPVFAGGESYDVEVSLPALSWTGFVSIVRSPLTLPGPAAWREDLGEIDEGSVEENGDYDEEELFLEENDIDSSEINELDEESNFVAAEEPDEEELDINEVDVIDNNTEETIVSIPETTSTDNQQPVVADEEEAPEITDEAIEESPKDQVITPVHKPTTSTSSRRTTNTYYGPRKGSKGGKGGRR